MIVRSGRAISILVEFASGQPDADVTWRLYDALGTQLASGTAAVDPSDVSINLTIDEALNQLAPGALFGSRDFEWNYTVQGAVVNGDQRYSVEARPPYGVSNDGVRTKLGVTSVDLADDEISLIRGYVAFRDAVGADALAAVTDEAALLSIRDAIEAEAALALIPTMAVRVAVQEDSGTNAYKRQTVDWTSVAQALSTLINAGILGVLPTYDPTPDGLLFILATPATDPFTGDSYT